MKRYAEVHLLIKILAVFGFFIILVLLAGYIFIKFRAPHLLEFSKGVVEYRVSVKLDSLDGAQFVTGMNGCENVLPVRDTSGIFISCLDGNIHYLEPDASGQFRIRRSYKAGEAVMGLAMSADDFLYAAVCTRPISDWFTKGGGIYRVSKDMSAKERITEDFPSINGICIDEPGNLYFASSKFSYIRPEGKVYRMMPDGNGSYMGPVPYIPDAGGANGLYYDLMQDKIFFSNTLGGIYEFTSQDSILQEVYLKLQFMEACDDLCTDISGNIWMTDPGHSSIKMYNPGTNRLARFTIDGIGQTSSCRIRSENGREMIYITELKQSQKPMSSIFDGRGVLIVPAQSLIRLLEPILTNKQ